ncbi:MAG: NAD(P)H-quinone oxidoreductase [Myxococcales bacterium]|nr:NAD(P)H-quinone oxidoreductase [Myxococcales bacterium]
MVKAIRIEGAGGPEVLTIDSVETPAAGAGEILIEVAAAGLNRADCLQRRGFYPAPKGTVADIPGLEFAGTVAGLGPDASRWSVGDRVMGICAGGAMSTHIAAHEGTLLAVPSPMSLTDAAALPEVFMTAFDALEQGGLRSGHRVLVHAAGSGVGTAAIQLIRRAGAVAIGTSRTEDKLDRAKALGMQGSLLVGEQRFAKELKAVGEGGGADIILDFIGAAYLAENIKALGTKGTLVVIGLLGGISAELPLGLLLAKRARVVGTVLRGRSLQEKIDLTTAFESQVLPGIASGELRPVIDRVMPMAEIAEAHTYLESNQSFGKIVMAW